MKGNVMSINGEKIKEIELPGCFSTGIRNDIIARNYESLKKKQPYAPFVLAGMQKSASGKIRHARRKWKTVYGYGVSRVPRKVFSRSGNRFSWQGATIASSRGGREAHPPKVEAILREKKLNKKERLTGLNSALSSTASSQIVSMKYNIDKKALSLPIIIDSVSEAKTREIERFLDKISAKIKKDKILIVFSPKESIKTKRFDSVSTDKLSVIELCPSGKPGRIVIYTEKAIEELKNLR